MLECRPAPPEGFVLIDFGSVRTGDWIWNADLQQWTPLFSRDLCRLGCNVQRYHAVARPQ